MTILEEVKQSLGYFGDEYDSYNQDILRSINTSIVILHRIGAISKTIVCTPTTQWPEIAKDDYGESLKEYVCQKVRMLFDPPQQSNTYKAYEESIKELEWTLLTRNEAV